MATPNYGFTNAPPASSLPPEQPGNGLAVAGLVCGIIGLVLCWVPVLGWILALLGIIFGAIGNSKAKNGAKGKGMALAGLILGVIGLVLGVALFIFAMTSRAGSIRREYRYQGALVLPAVDRG